MSLKNILKLFKNGNVCVTGLRGTGKDVLFGNVIYRLFTKNHIPYISNLDYGGYYIPLVLKDLNIKQLTLAVEQLQKRIEILETYAVTDIIEEPPKYYIVKRRLDPDKNN